MSLRDIQIAHPQEMKGPTADAEAESRLAFNLPSKFLSKCFLHCCQTGSQLADGRWKIVGRWLPAACQMSGVSGGSPKAGALAETLQPPC